MVAVCARETRHGTTMEFAKYDINRDYQWNYDNVPAPLQLEVPRVDGTWHFCGLPVDSPLGMPAGPLLNGRWILYYASLGFDVLTYKTVRSTARECHPPPNLLPVECGQLRGREVNLRVSSEMNGSWAVSFGMPSAAPEVWRDDIRRTRELLPKGKLLSVSVVGTIQDGWTIDDLANDYARCARWAVESGADTIETNFSCPNVSTCDGQLYQQPEYSAVIARCVREQIGDTPFVIKVGHIESDSDARSLLMSVAPYVSGLAITNSIATTVVDACGQAEFDGQRRGICGDATRSASTDQTRRLSRIIAAEGLVLELVGVGGVSTAGHVGDYLDAGAHAVQIATAAMVRPEIALQIRQEMAANSWTLR